MDRVAHRYLRPNSTVIELGGNIGDFTKHMIRRYKLRSYIVLEPMRRFYEKLKRELPKLNGNMRVLDIGLGYSNKIVELRDINDGTSAFMNSNDPRYTDKPLATIRIVNTIEFFSFLGVGCTDIDLLTINCEGCEIEVLEMLIETSMIKHFKNVQFQPHTNLKHLKNVTRRYCEIRERLAQTHRIFYSYPFLWESWQRK
ncbi:hypothetical protein FSP39_018402 [Pinctada imbricata]|uniref:Methyltransferase FkbM domain-containing protein n=1 Tax=Pinctada imbricata TaxID=66713 RepID=A0AA88XPS4_PINIB|nr:hypothetical protein FSP39_018402 [Pinctada imbricata]